MNNFFKVGWWLEIDPTDLYPVMMAPLLMGCSQVTRALVPPGLAWALGSLGLSGAPAPEITSRGADHRPWPALLEARTCRYQSY